MKAVVTMGLETFDWTTSRAYFKARFRRHCAFDRQRYLRHRFAFRSWHRAGMQRKETVLGHEGVGVVEEVGKGVRNVKVRRSRVIPSTIACGYCSYCRAGYYAQCDNANPNGPLAGTAFFGGPKTSGPFHGLQAEFARVPFANVGLVKLPEEVTDDQAILTSDIFPPATSAPK